MASALFLTAWASCGIAAAAFCASPGESKWAWTPMAVILGPLFHPVMVEHRPQAEPSSTLHFADDELIDLSEIPAEIMWPHAEHRLIP